MELYKEGDSNAFKVIFSRYKTKVYSYLSKRLSGDEMTEDVFQNVFLKFHRSKERYDPKFELSQWVYTICRSELLDYLKKKKIPFESLEESSHSAPETLIDNENGELESILKNGHTLSQNEKDAIFRKFYSDETYEEISSALNISSTNARKIISRGIKKLRLFYHGGK